ncbi:hypothetical protein Rs2_51000 [Raphanus sativus]|nr:hypothetical protein Rs2_51000 [Raphanus sativus]
MMLVVRGTVSNFNHWKQFFFYVRLDAASVEEEFIPMFRTVPNPLPHISVTHPWPRDIIEVRDTLRSGDHWWTSFTRRRVQKAIRLVHCDFEAEGDVDFAPIERLPDAFRFRDRLGCRPRTKASSLRITNFPLMIFNFRDGIRF